MVGFSDMHFEFNNSTVYTIKDHQHSEKRNHESNIYGYKKMRSNTLARFPLHVRNAQFATIQYKYHDFYFFPLIFFYLQVCMIHTNLIWQSFCVLHLLHQCVLLPKTFYLKDTSASFRYISFHSTYIIWQHIIYRWASFDFISIIWSFG